MRLADFQKEEAHHVHRFVQWWHARHDEDPEHFPLHMPHEQWRQAFREWTDGHPKRTLDETEGAHLDYMPEDGRA